MHKTINKKKKQEKPLVCHSNDGDGWIKKKSKTKEETPKRVSERCELFERESHLYILYIHACVMLCFSLSLLL